MNDTQILKSLDRRVANIEKMLGLFLENITPEAKKEFEDIILKQEFERVSSLAKYDRKPFMKFLSNHHDWFKKNIAGKS